MQAIFISRTEVKRSEIFLAKTHMLLAYWLQRDASHSPKGCEIFSCPNSYAVGILAAKGCESLYKGMLDFFCTNWYAVGILAAKGCE